MIDLAKSIDNGVEMIRLAQLFVQQPVPTLDGLPLPYCQEQPRNAELEGLYTCQFEGVVLNRRTIGYEGLPPNVDSVSPRGSCPALSRPLPNGHLLHVVASDPFGTNTMKIQV